MAAPATLVLHDLRWLVGPIGRTGKTGTVPQLLRRERDIISPIASIKKLAGNVIEIPHTDRLALLKRDKVECCLQRNLTIFGT